MKALAPLLLIAGSAAAEPECGEERNFACMQDYARAQIERLGLSPTGDQAKTLESIGALQSYFEGGPEAAVAEYEARGLDVYDLVFALTVARKTDDVRAAMKAASNLSIYGPEGGTVEGDEAFAALKRNVFNWHGDEDGLYVILCKGDADAFEAMMGSVKQEDACEAPYDPMAVRRVFGAIQIRRGLSGAEAFPAVMEYAFRQGACEVAATVLEATYHWKWMAHDEETAVWQILDVATLCAADLLEGMRL